MEKNRISNKSQCNIQNRQQEPMKGINKRSLICGQLGRAAGSETDCKGGGIGMSLYVQGNV